MAEKDDIQKRIQEEIARLNKANAEAYRDQLKGLDAINASLSTYENLLNNIKDDVANMDSGFSKVLEDVKAIASELQKGDKSTRDATKAIKGLESIASKLKYDQQGYNELSLEQLKTMNDGTLKVKYRVRIGNMALSHIDDLGLCLRKRIVMSNVIQRVECVHVGDGV